MKIQLSILSSIVFLFSCKNTTQPSDRFTADTYAIASALKFYHMSNGHFPSTAQGLQALMTKPTGDPQPAAWTKLMDCLPLDSWGQPYKYECFERKTSEGYKTTLRLVSSGRDTQMGTVDDLENLIPLL